MGTIRMLTRAAQLTLNCYRSRPDVLRRRERRFRDLLRHAYDESPFYRRRFDDRDITRRDLDTIALSELPTLAPATFESAFDRISTDPDVTLAEIRAFIRESDDRHERYKGTYVVLRSSGTEGEPTPFVYSPAEWDRALAADVRMLVAGLGLPDFVRTATGANRTAYFAGIDGRFMGVTALTEVADRLGDEVKEISPNVAPERVAETVAAFDPTALVGYPSTLVIVADLVTDGQCDLSLDRVLSAGEPLPEDTRTYLEDAFDAPVLNFYATTECGAIGVEPAGETEMSLFDDLVLLERREGRTLVTPLYHRTLPLIRFELPDTLELTPRADDSGLPFSTVKSVIGRSEEFLRLDTPAGKRLVFSTILNDITASGVSKYQFVQTAPDAFDVRIKCRQDAEPETVRRNVRREVSSLLSTRDLDSVSFRVVEREIRHDTHTGKAPLVAGSRYKSVGDHGTRYERVSEAPTESSTGGGRYEMSD